MFIFAALWPLETPRSETALILHEDLLPGVGHARMACSLSVAQSQWCDGTGLSFQVASQSGQRGLGDGQGPGGLLTWDRLSRVPWVSAA